MNAASLVPLKFRRALVGAATLLAFASVSSAASSPVIAIVRGAHQQAVSGTAFSAPLEVQVTDPANGQGVAGMRVDFVSGTGICLSAPYAITDEHGLASVSATGLGVGTSGAQAEIAGIPGVRVRFEGLVVGADSGSRQDVLRQASLPALETAAPVRAALVGQPTPLMIPQPSFVAGLRGQSGVFVVNAMWPDDDRAPRTAPILFARTALPPVSLESRKMSGAPVRAVLVSNVPSSTAPAQAFGGGFAIRKAFNPGTN